MSVSSHKAQRGCSSSALKRTRRFSIPTSSWASVSRASSLCPTSSNASVASWPATSRRTSSPPLHSAGQRFISNTVMGSKKVQCLRVLVNKLARVIDLLVYHEEYVLSCVVLRHVLICVFLLRHGDRWARAPNFTPFLSAGIARLEGESSASRDKG
jgi:hypothetical protein